MHSQLPPPIPAIVSPVAPRSGQGPSAVTILVLGGLGLAALAVVCFFVVVLASIENVPVHVAKSDHVRTTLIRGGNSDRIAHIDLEGIISASTSQAGESMVDDFNHLVDAALDDDSVKAIVIRINSPGGEVTASDRLHHIIELADERKPVVAYLDTIAASGGYYAACAGRKIISHPTTFTGSIGVIMQSVKYGELIDKVGVSMEVYKSGELKDLLSGTRETSPAEASLVNELIQETYTRFLGVVSESRGKSVEDLRASPLTDGRIFSGAQALEAGMVDGNGFIEDAYDEAMELAGVSDASVVRYTPKIGLWDAFSGFGASAKAQSRVEIDLSDRLFPRMQNGVPLYLHLDGYGSR